MQHVGEQSEKVKDGRKMHVKVGWKKGMMKRFKIDGRIDIWLMVDF